MEATALLEPRTPTSLPASDGFGKRMALVLGLAAVLFFARLSERAFWSEEVRWAQIPREMQRNGDYLWPTFNGQTYYDKPLGSYWLVLLSSFITGGFDETAARLPSALSGIVAIAFAMLIARRLAGDDTAILTGIILATSFSFVFWARTASTDMETVAGVLAALWIFLRYEDRPSGGWILFFWIVMALTSLTKGLLGFALPVLIVGAYAINRPLTGLGSPLSFFANRWSLAAMPLGALLYLGPFLLSIAVHGSSHGLDMVYRENIRRFFDPVNHKGPIYLYSYVIFILLAPWSLLLPAALVHAHTCGDRKSRANAFALAYFWSVFIFFTLSSSRRSYYLLPILPAAAFLIARMLAAPEPFGKTTRLLLANLGRARICAFMKPIAIVAMIGCFLIALPAMESTRTQKAFADAVRQAVPSVENITLFETREIVYYLNPSAPLAQCQDPENLRNGWVIMRRRNWERLNLDARVVVEETLQGWPWEDAGGKLVLVELR